LSIIHSLAAHGRGHLSGVQATQRDWSPFLAHFTTWSAMNELRSAVKRREPPGAVADLLNKADETSFGTSQKIVASKKILARSPSDKDGLPSCVCLSECTLPGLISHCERYGRFGFVFSKELVFAAGGRPCIYVGRDEYSFIATSGRGKTPDTSAGKLFALANLYEPRKAGVGAKVQDYTHEREWRMFTDLNFAQVKIEAAFAPSNYAKPMAELMGAVPIVPIDMLFEWGA
jgi:hypothetical protein